MTNGTDPWSVIMNTDPLGVPPEASDYMYADVGRVRPGEYLDAQISLMSNRLLPPERFTQGYPYLKAS
jgi:hypothetical protein